VNPSRGNRAGIKVCARATNPYDVFAHIQALEHTFQALIAAALAVSSTLEKRNNDVTRARGSPGGARDDVFPSRGFRGGRRAFFGFFAILREHLRRFHLGGETGGGLFL